MSERIENADPRIREAVARLAEALGADDESCVVVLHVQKSKTRILNRGGGLLLDLGESVCAYADHVATVIERDAGVKGANTDRYLRQIGISMTRILNGVGHALEARVARLIDGDGAKGDVS